MHVSTTHLTKQKITIRKVIPQYQVFPMFSMFFYTVLCIVEEIFRSRVTERYYALVLKRVYFFGESNFSKFDRVYTKKGKNFYVIN
jgi:hypothetical protein